MGSHLVLTEKTEAVLTPTSPFSFDGTMFKPSHYPTPDRAYESGVYWQSFRYDANTIVGLKFTNIGDVGNPKVLLQVFYEPGELILNHLEEIVGEIRYRFNYDCDLQAFMNEVGSDSLLTEPLRRWAGLRISSPYSLYEFLIVTTLLQNTQVRRSVQMMRNLFESYGKSIRFDNKVLFGFWHPTEMVAVTEQDLREKKLGYRAKTLTRQAAFILDNKLDVGELRSTSRDNLKEKLLAIYGVGPATVQYIMSEVFHHYDVLDHIPPWEQKIYSRLLFDEELIEVQIILDELDKRYGKWKVLAVHYLFEDLFWRRRNAPVEWLEKLIRL